MWFERARLSYLIHGGAGTAYPSGAPNCILRFYGIRIAQSLVFYLDHFLSFNLLAIVLSECNKKDNFCNFISKTPYGL
jgi:hypothetical protein